MAIDLREQLQATLGSSYTIERELGGGGMSRVFVAHEAALQRAVVVKVLPPDLASELSAERFRREIQLAARLQHPHIVPVLTSGAGATGGTGNAEILLYYTMPLIEGETLRSRLSREGELPVADVIRIAGALSDALAYAHERGVVHRDLKPENVLLTRGHALVADFGVAKAVSASVKSGAGSPVSGLTSVGLALGTPAYMAPEQASADPATDHRADLYALGCVLYELLAGTPPFFGRPTQSLLAAHIAEAPEPIARRRPATPPLLAALIMRMLEKRPADRPQSADEVLRSLEVASTQITITDGQVVAGAPATTEQTTLGSVTGDLTVPLRRMPSKTAWRIGLLGGLIAGVVLIGIVVTAGGGRRAEKGDIAKAHTIALQPFENRGGSEQPGR